MGAHSAKRRSYQAVADFLAAGGGVGRLGLGRYTTKQLADEAAGRYVIGLVRAGGAAVGCYDGSIQVTMPTRTVVRVQVL